jgi:VWFA-related protein
MPTATYLLDWNLQEEFKDLLKLAAVNCAFHGSRLNVLSQLPQPFGGTVQRSRRNDKMEHAWLSRIINAVLEPEYLNCLTSEPPFVSCPGKVHVTGLARFRLLSEAQVKGLQLMIGAFPRVFLSIALCAPIVAAGQASDQGAAPTIRVDTNLVIVNVVVTDANQNPVHNLTAADFDLREDGQAQTIKTFERHTANEEHTADEAAKVPQPPTLHKLDSGVFTNDSPVPANGPLNIVLLDKLNTPEVDQAYCVDQLSEYLKGAPAGTRIAILSLTSSQLFLLQGFTADPELLRAALSSKNAAPRTSLYLDYFDQSDNGLQGDTGVIATGGGPKYGYRLQLTMEALHQIGRYLVQLPGRKNLLWFSASFPISMLPMGTDNLFAHNQIAVYPITAHGLLTNPRWDGKVAWGGSDTRAIEESNKKTALGDAYNKWAATDLADPTGGKAFLNNDLKGNMARAIEAGSNY